MRASVKGAWDYVTLACHIVPMLGGRGRRKIEGRETSSEAAAAGRPAVRALTRNGHVRCTCLQPTKAFWAMLGAAVAICALCAIVIQSKADPAELLEVRLPNGEFARLVPVQSLKQRRMTQLFGPGDLPIPIEDDGMPGGNFPAHMLPRGTRSWLSSPGCGVFLSV